MGKNLPPGTSDEAGRSLVAGHMFRGSHDFFLAYRLIGAFRASAEVRQGRAPSPIQSLAANAAFALELALKARLVLDGGEPPSRGPDGHSYSAIFRLLSSGAKADVASLLLVGGNPTTPEKLVEVLRELEGTFEKWRYMHEHDQVVFDEGNMVAVIHAVYFSIVRARPDFLSLAGSSWTPIGPSPGT